MARIRHRDILPTASRQRNHTGTIIVKNLDGDIIIDENGIFNGAIDFKNLRSNKFFGMGNFNSTDGWTKTAGVTQGSFGANIQTDGTPSNSQYFYPSGNLSHYLDPNKNPMLQTTIYTVSNTSQVFYAGCGDLGEVSQNSGFGVKIVNENAFWCWNVSGTEYLEQVVGIIIATTINNFRFEYDSEKKEIRFYLNGVLKYTAKKNLPIDPYPQILFSYALTSSSVRNVYPIDWMFQMDR